MRSAAVIVAVALVLAACSDAENKSKPLSVPGEKLYVLKGKVLSRDAADNTIRVDHDAIPGFMEAMTMDYSVRGATVSELPADGTRVQCSLHVTETGFWVTNVQKVQK